MKRLRLICLLMLFAGCVRVLRPTPRDVTLETLSAHYQTQRDALYPFRALLSLSAHAPNAGRYTVLAKWQSGDPTEIEGFTFFGTTLFNLTLTPSHLTLNATDRTISVARDALDSVHTLPGGLIEAMESTDVIDWVNGVALPQVSATTFLSLRWQEGVLLLLRSHPDAALSKTGWTERLWIEPTDFHLLRVERFHPDGRRISVVLFDDYRKIAQTDFPFSVYAEAGGYSVTLKFKEVVPFKHDHLRH